MAVDVVEGAEHAAGAAFDAVFKGDDDLLLVAFRSGDLGPGLKFESSRGGELFPHLYGPLPTALALWQRALELGPDGVPVVKMEWLEC